MNADRLVVTMEATHQSLQQRLDEATRASRGRPAPRARQALVDAFAAATSRHLAAVEEVLLPEAAHRSDAAAERAEDYLRAARHLEHALARVKARQYGEQHVAHLAWPAVWNDVRGRLSGHNDAERALVAELTGHLDDDRAGELAFDLYRAELRAPTRAHPYIPHTGLLGHLARRVWSVADRFWDTAEGRVVPEPVRSQPRDHSHDSLLRQYLTGVPHLDAEAPVIGPRQHRRAARRSVAQPDRPTRPAEDRRQFSRRPGRHESVSPTQGVLKNLR